MVGRFLCEVMKFDGFYSDEIPMLWNSGKHAEQAKKDHLAYFGDKFVPRPTQPPEIYLCDASATTEGEPYHLTRQDPAGEKYQPNRPYPVPTIEEEEQLCHFKMFGSMPLGLIDSAEEDDKVEGCNAAKCESTKLMKYKMREIGQANTLIGQAAALEKDEVSEFKMAPLPLDREYLDLW